MEGSQNPFCSSRLLTSGVIGLVLGLKSKIGSILSGEYLGGAELACDPFSAILELMGVGRGLPKLSPRRGGVVYSCL